MGQAQHNVGWFLSRSLADAEQLKDALKQIVHGEPIEGAKASVVGGALAEAKNRGLDVLSSLVAGESADTAVSILLAAPFDHLTWKVAEDSSAGLGARYWKEVAPGWNRTEDDV